MIRHQSPPITITLSTWCSLLAAAVAWLGPGAANANAGLLHGGAFALATAHNTSNGSSTWDYAAGSISRTADAQSSNAFGETAAAAFGAAGASWNQLLQVKTGVNANVDFAYATAGAQWNDTLTILAPGLGGVASDLLVQLRFGINADFVATPYVNGSVNLSITGGQENATNLPPDASFSGGVNVGVSSSDIPNVWYVSGNPSNPWDSAVVNGGAFAGTFHFTLDLRPNGRTDEFSASWSLQEVMIATSDGGEIGIRELDPPSVGALQAVLLPDGSTPESHGYQVSFDSGLPSPNLAAVPEPSSLVLLGSGGIVLVGTALIRRRAKAPRRRRQPQLDRLEGRWQPNGLAGSSLSGALVTDLLPLVATGDPDPPAEGSLLSRAPKRSDPGQDHGNARTSPSRASVVLAIVPGLAPAAMPVRTAPSPAAAGTRAPSGPIGILASGSPAPAAATTIGPAGTVTTSFGNAGATANAVAIEPLNGLNMIVAAGNELPSGTNVQHSALARYNPDGSLDQSFGNGGIVTANFSGGYYPGDSIQSVAIQSDGKIVVAGRAALKPKGFSRYEDFLLARYNTNGTLDTSFNKSGYVIAPFSSSNDYADSANGVALQTVNGTTRIVVAGAAQTTSSGGHSYMALARYNLNGSLDTTFGSGGKVLTSYPGATGQRGFAMALQSDGSIVVAGEAYGLSSSGPEIAVARYLPNGSLDASFGNGGEVVYPDTNFRSSNEQLGLAIQSDGKIVVGGGYWNAAAGNDYFAAVRFNADGSLDGAFGSNGLAVEGLVGDATALAIQPATGQIDLGGSDYQTGSFVVYQLNSTDGSLDPNFGNGGVTTTAFPANATANALAIQPNNGYIVQAGTTSGDFALARYTTSGQLDPTC